MLNRHRTSRDAAVKSEIEHRSELTFDKEVWGRVRPGPALTNERGSPRHVAGVPLPSCLADYWVGDILRGQHPTGGPITSVSLARVAGVRPVVGRL